MAKLKLAISARSLGLSLRQAVEEARRLGVAGIELPAAGELLPQKLSQTGRRELRRMLRTHGVELSALDCPLRQGFDTPENLQPRIEHVERVLAMSYDLGARVVVVQAGRIPEKLDDPRAGLLDESLRALAQHGDRVGAILALETGLESAETLKSFLARFDTGSLGVNYDPANLLMNGFDPLASAQVLGQRIVYAQAKDARGATASRSAQEVPLGHGDIDWMEMLAVFEQINYRGWLTVERESGTHPREDVAAGVGFLRRLLG
jgi:L-ribulose-5-phosphate 3-epimerase